MAPLKILCKNCGKLYSEHYQDTARCTDNSGRRYEIAPSLEDNTIINQEPKLVSDPYEVQVPKGYKRVVGSGFTMFTCLQCYALVMIESHEKHTTFHEGAKAWLEHLLKESKG